jgi:hypothetical protein
MKAHAVRKGDAIPLVGRVLCHDVRDAAGKVAAHKGQVVDEAAAGMIAALPWSEIHILEIEPGDLHEEEAGGRLASAVIGDGVEVKGYTGGQWSLAAARRGVLRIETSLLERVNALEGIAIFTLYSGLTVESGEVVARAKVTPLVVPVTTVESIEEWTRGAGGLLRVVAFSPRTIGAVSQERLEPKQRSRFEASLAEKIAWFGSRLLPVRYASATPETVAQELRRLADAGAEILIVAGASALDPLDPVFSALSLVGARMERHGAPAHPGSLLWVARWGERTILGMPTCGMFSQATTFDLVLPRLLSGERIGNREVADLGHGGLLSKESAFRFPPYRANAARGELDQGG